MTAKYLLHFFFLLLVIPLQAQKSGNEVFLQIISGQVTENKQNFGGIYGADVGYITSLKNNYRDWTRKLNAKDMVWTFHWRNMNSVKNGADSIQHFGNVIGLSMSANFAFLNIGNLQFDFTPTIGLSYFSKTSILNYNGEEGVGSKINDLVSAGINTEMPINNKFSMLAGFNFMHFSNAGFQNPNGGINSWNIKLGVKSKFNRERKIVDSIILLQKFKHPEGSSFELSAGIGRRGVDSSHRGFLRSGLYAGYNYGFTQVIAFKAGFDAIYYHTVFDSSKFAQTFQDFASSFDHFATGISIGVDINMNKFVVTYQLGKYLHFKGPNSLKWYWKGGFRYYFTSNIGINSIVYLNSFNADFINWGIVWRFQ